MSDGYGKSARFSIDRAQAVRLIVQTCLDHGVTDERQIAYVLATAEHESQGFTKSEEDHGRKQAVQKGYMGGEAFFGRGYAHLTHDDNYLRLGEALGLGRQLLEEPARATEPRIASDVLVRGMRDDLFTQRGRGLDHYINGDNADYTGARRIVNLQDRAEHVARLARRWEPRIADLVTEVRRDGVELTPLQVARDPDAPMQRGDANARVFEMQQYLAALGATHRAGQPLQADGDFGPGTQGAVRRYQESLGIDPPTGMVDQALFERMRASVLQADPDFRLKSIDDLYGPLNDRVLGPGDRGDPVEDLQLQLVGLGYLARDTSPLGVSRKYDRATGEAVQCFQEDRSIVPVNGLADERTRDEINARAVERGLPETVEAVRRREEAEAAAQHPRPAPAPLARPGCDPYAALDEPDRAMLEQLRGQVRLLDRQVGKGWDEDSERLAASALVMAKESGFAAGNNLRLGLNAPTGSLAGGTVLHLARAGPGASADPVANHATMVVSDALSVSTAERFRRVFAIADAQAGQRQVAAAQEWQRAGQDGLEARQLARG